jgi:excisionase family DNA binding protein
MQETVKLAYRRKEAAKAIGVSARKIDYLISEGKLKARKLGGIVLISHSELVKMLEAR